MQKMCLAGGTRWSEDMVELAHRQCRYPAMSVASNPGKCGEDRS
jgi:hypothetical protein